MFIVNGSYTKTAEQTNIARTTIQSWAKTEWWLTNIVSVRHEKAEELDAQVSNSINKAIKSVDDRLDQGDAYIVPKTGEIAYKPVSCRDSATVLGILYDKRQIMRLLPTAITASTDSDKLLKLQQSFEQLAHEKTKQIEASIVAEG